MYVPEELSLLLHLYLLTVVIFGVFLVVADLEPIVGVFLVVADLEPIVGVHGDCADAITFLVRDFLFHLSWDLLGSWLRGDSFGLKEKHKYICYQYTINLHTPSFV